MGVARGIIATPSSCVVGERGCAGVCSRGGFRQEFPVGAGVGVGMRVRIEVRGGNRGKGRGGGCGGFSSRPSRLIYAFETFPILPPPKTDYLS